MIVEYHLKRMIANKKANAGKAYTMEHDWLKNKGGNIKY